MSEILYILMAIGIFFLATILHESVHYLTAKRLGKEAHFAWISSKEKHTVGIFGWLPGVRIKDVNTVHELKWISLAPIPFGFICYFFMFIVATWEYWQRVIWDWRGFLVLGVVIIFSILTTYAGSARDIKDYFECKGALS